MICHPWLALNYNQPIYQIWALYFHSLRRYEKGKGFPYSLLSIAPGADPIVKAVSPQVTVSHPPGGRLPLLSVRPAVIFPAAEHHHPLAGTKLYCLVTEAHRCEQHAQGSYAAFAPSRIWTHDLLIVSPMLCPLRHHEDMKGDTKYWKWGGSVS